MGFTKTRLKRIMKKTRLFFPGDYDFLNIGTPIFRYFKSEDDAKNNNETPAYCYFKDVLDQSMLE